MAIVDRMKDLPCLAVRGKHSLPGGLGDFVLGKSQLGYLDEKNGVYQMRHRLKPGVPYTLDKRSPKVAVKCKYYWPPYPGVAGQIASREKFQNAMTAWNALTFEQKAPWKARAAKAHQPMPNLFVKAYMLDEPLIP